ncbi:hypothetical protein ABQX22_26800, partial [Xanthomonas sp. WHRI 1810A]|uniref:hypothetical protein n=1 Tax=Xanthomonas sp. WHRI 1810A TaxID=3161565 RepID=UPI0032E8C229
ECTGFTAAARQIAGKPAPTPSAEADRGATWHLILAEGRTWTTLRVRLLILAAARMCTTLRIRLFILAAGRGS